MNLAHFSSLSVLVWSLFAVSRSYSKFLSIQFLVGGLMGVIFSGAGVFFGYEARSFIASSMVLW